MHRCTLSFTLLLSAGLLLSAAAPQNAPSAAPAPRPATKQKVPGLPNFGQVSDTLFRGAQPKDAGYAELKKQGVEIVVSFREHPGQIADERRAVEAQGMRFVSIPWPSMDAPRNAQVAEFLELLRANPGKKIFAHCRRGAERTGVMVAAYRIAVEHWTPQQALEEMEVFGFRGFWFRHFKNYIRKFPTLLDSDPTFKPLAAPAK
ncbi:MAG: tyrosine-protein phosphatase [Acidobacteria bacterium]|nr:tyrosine-protein phosphatase [Acidobacteriota bacterium]